MKNIKSATVVIPVLVTLGLIYSNLYESRYANTLFFVAIVAWIAWWLVNFQFVTGERPGLLTSKTGKVLSQAHADKLHADANVLHAEAEIYVGHAAIATGKFRQAEGEFKLKEAPGNFTRDQLLKEAMHNNQLAITQRATEMGIPVENLIEYLTKSYEQKVNYDTAVLIAQTELKKERQSIEETIRFTLTESSLKFDERLALIEDITEIQELIDKTTNRTKKKLLQEEMDTLKARLDATRQIDLPKADGAQA